MVRAAGAHVATYSNRAGAGVGAPYDLAIDPNDTSSCGSGGGQCSDFWVADQEQGDVVEFNHTGGVVRTLGHDGTGAYHHGPGCGGGLVTFPTHLVVDPSNGNLYIKRASWNEDYLEELCLFPAAPHDDQVDATSGAFAQFVTQRGEHSFGTYTI